MQNFFRPILCVLLAGATIPASLVSEASAQATAPVTHDHHLHTHNDPHPRSDDESRFITNREGADLELPAEDDAFTFAVFGDRSGGPNEGVDILAQAVADTNLIEPDLVMTVGDLIQGYSQTADWHEQMLQFRQIMNNLLCPWFPVAGNHDIYWRGQDPAPKGEHEESYEIHFGPLWYAFDHKGSRFIVLYAEEGDPVTGKKDFKSVETQRMSDAQIAWLKATLASARDAEHVFIFIHHPRWIGGQYGDEWDRIHPILLEAGNVSAVFAGHLHRMRYDPKDGIEYVTLATVGGSQGEYSPAAGFLHQFHLVTVRPNQIAMASIPVGETLDVRKVTGDVSIHARALARVRPKFSEALEVAADGSVSQELEITIENPVEAEIDVELHLRSADSRWTFYPSHTHRKLAPGETVTQRFRVECPANTMDRHARPIEAELGIDLLTDAARFPIKRTQTLVPGSLFVVEPDRPAEERVLTPNRDGGVTVPMGQLKLKDGPITLECWVNPTGFDGRDGVIGSHATGFYLDDGWPGFYVRVNDRRVEVRPENEEPLELNRPYHLAGVYDQTEARLYIDGQLVASTPAPAEGKLTRYGFAFTVGAEYGRFGPEKPMFGWVDEVRLSQGPRYTAAFTPERRLSPDENTRLLYHMDGKQGHYIFDSSAGENHGELRGEAELVGPSIEPAR